LNAAELLIQEGQNDQAAALLQFLAVHETSEADQQVRAAELLSSFESGKPEKLTSLEESANQLLSLWGEID
jgi:outer membrane PBP1 activator LpoA protein